MGSHKEVSACLIASVDGELEGSLILHRKFQRDGSMRHCMICEHRGQQPTLKLGLWVEKLLFSCELEWQHV